jgi:hypothetical protein
MISNADDRHTLSREEAQDERRQKVEAKGADKWKLRRWLVSFRSGAEWYSVGEFTALNAADAIERAVGIFGSGAAHQAEEIPWDAAPLPKTVPRPPRGDN